jgi:hypothetical protein
MNNTNTGNLFTTKAEAAMSAETLVSLTAAWWCCPQLLTTLDSVQRHNKDRTASLKVLYTYTYIYGLIN